MTSASIPNLDLQALFNPLEPFSDSRRHGYQGPSRYVRLGRVAPSGGAALAKSQDGTRCAVAGKESLRIVRISGPTQPNNPDHKSAIGPGGHRIDASRNFWDNSGLKIDSASTDVAWGHGAFNNKILTSARNGELILWDLNKSGTTKYERRTKDHIRSINKLSVSHVVHYYCITGSADGDMRIWDLRDLSKSLMRVKHPTSVRSVVFSPSVWQPLQAVVGLDNGTLHRWDLKMGQRGGLDRLPVAHSAPVTTLDWCSSSSSGANNNAGSSNDASGNGLGWLVSGGLDRCVKVWDLTSPSANAHIPSKPTYTLHPSFPVRRVSWRPGYECELAIVSNEDFASPSLDVPHPTPGVVPGILSRVGSGLGLDAMLKGFNSDNHHTPKDTVTQTGDTQRAGSTLATGDAIEIWDVRREWVAKWSVNGSSLEGSISDIAFGDSHAIWSQYSGGAFTQFDLRDTSKPISALTRVSTTWDVGGSLTFVANRKNRWEAPYDDVVKQQAETRTELRKIPLKALGDPPVRLRSQTLGTFVSEDSMEELEVFTVLARTYRFEGQSRKDICEINAQIALQAGQQRTSQAWLLVATSLTDYIPTFPPTPPQSPRPKSRKALPIMHPPSGQTPSTTPNSYTFPPLSSSAGDAVQSLHRSGRKSVRPGNATSISSRSRSASASRHLTPSSSNSPSPRHLSIGLPPLTPNKATLFTRRDSVDSGILRRHPSAYRRSSLSTTGQSASPSERAFASLRHVGEGALDDSSSSSDGKDDIGDTPGANLSDEDYSMQPLKSPTLPFGKQIAVPSPLSRVAGQQQWSEDEDEPDPDNDDEASSPSPRSTDTESDDSSSSRRQAKSRLNKRTSFRMKSRSRSSTVASLAAPPRLVHQNSRSSIRTVTAAENSFKEVDDPRSLHQEDTIIESPSNSRRRQKSQPFSEHVSGEYDKGEEVFVAPDSAKVSQRRLEIIRSDEKRYREIAWNALRETLEDFAAEGDIQMCAMMCLLAREELKLPPTRVLRILEAYIERLSRLRLYTCAAYVRKYSNIEAIRNQSLVETVIYTSCGKCYKPLLKPAIPARSSGMPSKGAYSYCLGCKANSVVCSICQLPVRALMFQCSICNHGGHQACYRRYYMEHPMVELPTSFLPSTSEDRGRPLSRHAPMHSEDDATSMSSTRSGAVDTSVGQSPTRTERSSIQKLMAHPCAAGCGHYCWAANGVIDVPEV